MKKHIDLYFFIMFDSSNTSFFNFVNRIALGLGVEFSEEEKTGYNY